MKIATLSPDEIAQYAASAGFSGNDLATAVAIAIAESSGNVGAVGDKGIGAPDYTSFGLWQIHVTPSVHANLLPLVQSGAIFDPLTNAQLAMAIYSAAGGFSPWTTYKTGAYRAFLPAQTLAPTTDGSPAVDVTQQQQSSDIGDGLIVLALLGVTAWLLL